MPGISPDQAHTTDQPRAEDHVQYSRLAEVVDPGVHYCRQHREEPVSQGGAVLAYRGLDINSSTTRLSVG